MEEIKWRARSYTKEEFINAWESANSIAECARKLNLTIFGTTYTTLKSTAKLLNLNEDHFRGQAWRKGLKGAKGGKHLPLEEYLVDGKKTPSSSLKKKILKAGLLENKCAAPFCPVPNPSVNPFTGEPTPLKLALDHINGNNTDNRLENLRLLCYHCHGETDTWCGKDRVKKKAIYKKELCHCGNEKYYKSKQCLVCHRAEITAKSTASEVKKFCECGKQIDKKSKQCKSCSAIKRNKATKITLTPDEIVVLIESGNETYESLGRAQEVSGNAIRKFLKRNDIIPPKSSNKKQLS